MAPIQKEANLDKNRGDVSTHLEELPCGWLQTKRGQEMRDLFLFKAIKDYSSQKKETTIIFRPDERPGHWSQNQVACSALVKNQLLIQLTCEWPRRTGELFLLKLIKYCPNQNSSNGQAKDQVTGPGC